MKIAIFTDCFFPQVNGVVTSTMLLAKGLAERGHSVHMIVPWHPKYHEFDYPNIALQRIPSIPAFFYKDFRFTKIFCLKLYKFLRNELIDIIHFHTPLPLGIKAVIMSKMLKIPLVGTFHTFFPDKEYLRHVGLNYILFQKIAWFYCRIVYNQCDLITCPTKGAVDILRKNGLKSKIVSISNGIDFEMFDGTFKTDLFDKHNDIYDYILYVGRISYEKNVNQILECFKIVTDELSDTRLIVVGDGPQMKEFKATISKYSLNDKVILLGELNHSDLVKSDIYKFSKIYVTTSSTETQGIATMEAQANGIVCVGFDACGTNELIKYGYNGYIVSKGNVHELAKKIKLLLTDKNMYKQMKQNTLNKIKKHDINHIIKVWEDQYKIIVKSNSTK